MSSNDSAPGKIGVIGASAIGIGGMVGGGIFAVLGTAVLLAGGGTPVAFAVAGVVAILTGYSYAKLSVALPTSGGTTAFIDRAFRINYATGSLNVVLWLSYLVTIALYASAFGAYGMTFFSPNPSWLRHLLISVAIVMPAVLNALSSTMISKSETTVVALKLVLLALVIAAGASQVKIERIAPSTWESPGSIIIAGMVIFVAFEGFELISNSAEDVKAPSHTLPRAIFISIGTVIALYVLVAIVTVGSVEPSEIIASKDFALAAAARPSLGHAGFVLVSISALLATFSAINATVYGNARLGFALAMDGEIPAIFERRAWRRPLYGVGITAVLSLLLANLVDLESMAVIASAGFLLIFSAVNASAFRLSSQIGSRRWVNGLAIAASTGALVALLKDAYDSTPEALVVFAGLLIAAGVFEFVYPLVSGREFEKLREAWSRFV